MFLLQKSSSLIIRIAIENTENSEIYKPAIYMILNNMYNNNQLSVPLESDFGEDFL